MGKIKRPHEKARKIATKTVAFNNPPVKPFPIVAFGASAGGVEAFSAVLSNLSADLGMAYVLVMHLSPNHKSALAEILQLKTSMKVNTVRNGMEVKINNVYVIPPNTSMSIVDGHLKLAARDITTNGNFAIDYFLTALASVYKNNSIGVILSGTATDGTLGLKAIKAEGGITFAQDSSAKFPSMPKNAYESGYADFFLSPDGISKELASLAKIPYPILPSENIQANNLQELEGDKEVLEKILSIVKTRTGIDFHLDYKQASVYRRVVRRVALHKLFALEDYHSMLRQHPNEVDELFNDFLINVTNFFRDADFYEALNKEIIPSIIEGRKSTDPFRIWVAGCSTGEEAYSIAIMLTEYLEKKNLIVPYQIFASDLDANAIEKARQAIYPVSAVHNIAPDRLNKFFKKIDGHYQVVKSIREACIFSLQSLLKDPPFSRMDLISCQNVLIYLENDAQQKILHTFHYALKSTGYLFLGKSESIGNAIELFDPIGKKLKMYRRRPAHLSNLDFISKISEPVAVQQLTGVSSHPTSNLEKEISKTILTSYVMPCVVVNEQLNIVQFFGITSDYLSPAMGKASLNILKMVREDLLIDLRTLIQQVKRNGKTVSKEKIRIQNKKVWKELTLEVTPKKIDNEQFLLIVFKESAQTSDKVRKIQKRLKTTKGQKDQVIMNLEDELSRSRELIKSTNEEYETTYEELQANNEQILSSNEELHSINEEMETSKEELQSSNEELTTINEELQKRNVELKASQNYAKAIVDTVNSPFLVLTSNLQVRTANNSFYETFKLKPDTTEGSFIYELGDHSWDSNILRENLNDLLGKKTNFKEFKFEHFFPRLGDMAFIVNAYRLMKEDTASETLILLAFNNIGELIKSNDNLKSVNEQLEQFIFVSGHDLQEPLRKIQTFANYLHEYENVDTYVKKYVGKISETALRTSTRLRDLLSYSALLHNRAKNPVKTELDQVLKEVLSNLEAVIIEKGAVVEFGKLPVIIADTNQMNMLFMNLLGNALKFNRGKPLIKVKSESISSLNYDRYGLDKERNYVCVAVSDNGIGFNQKYIPKIFSIFQRLHDKPGIEGTGMGLAIAKKIVEDHGGRIFAEGRENEGATFSVFLPRV